MFWVNLSTFPGHRGARKLEDAPRNNGRVLLMKDTLNSMLVAVKQAGGRPSCDVVCADGLGRFSPRKAFRRQVPTWWMLGNHCNWAEWPSRGPRLDPGSGFEENNHAVGYQKSWSHNMGILATLSTSCIHTHIFIYSHEYFGPWYHLPCTAQADYFYAVFERTRSGGRTVPKWGVRPDKTWYYPSDPSDPSVCEMPWDEQW